jgi:uncharacterized membrane protein YoaK (UPF0700 family)
MKVRQYGRRGVLLASALSAIAGYVDAVGFMLLGGFFVSFMSGNTTRVGVALARGDLGHVFTGLGLIVLFVVGVVIGAMVSRRFGETRRWGVMAVEALFLFTAAAAWSFDIRAIGAAAMVMAMGIENSVFQRKGEVAVPLTYMTGALVKLGQRISLALEGGDPWAWLPQLMLWGGLLAGGALGATAFLMVGSAALWAAAVLVCVLAVLVYEAERRARTSRQKASRASG